MATVLNIQMCLFVGESACGLDGARVCPFCDIDEHAQVPSHFAFPRDVFDDSSLPWWNNGVAGIPSRNTDNYTVGLLYD